MRTRKPGTSPSMQPDAMNQKNASGLNREIQSKIGQQLRAIYDDVVQEGVPAAIPAEACYLGWQESLTLLKMLVEAEIPE